MAYSKFTLKKAKEDFDLTFVEDRDLFSQVPARELSEALKATLAENVPLALSINTEKARSEMIISPILIELRKVFERKISLFSGVSFTVDEEKELNGNCDFLISCSSEQLFITSPVVTIVEAKNENFNLGMGQCVAEMVAAKLFNEREQSEVSWIYGVVTTGNVWKFLKLDQSTVYIDIREYHVDDVAKVLGILSKMVNQEA
jgi:hypothetical protein